MPREVNLDIQGTLKDLFLSMVISWRNLVAIGAGSIFNGSDPSIATLTELISDGKFVGATIEEDIVTTGKRTTSMMYAFLIPVTWSLRGISPVVISTDNGCKEVGEGTSDWVSAEDAKAASFCHEDKLHYLLSLPEPYRTCSANPCAPCKKGFMKLPPGLDELPNEKWGGISKKDIIAG